jgi:hypothetical protein
MKRLWVTGFVLCLMLALAGESAQADVKMQQKSQMKFAGMLGKMMNLFGGKAAKEGMVSTVSLKGDRKMTVSDQTAELVDLNEEKVYQLDMRKKTYKVVTFDQMRRELEETRRKAEKETQKASKDKDVREMEIDFEVRETGQSRTIGGHNCREVIMKITVREKGKKLEEGGGLVMTSNLWLTPEIQASKELADFDLRYMQKLHGESAGDMAAQMIQAMAMYPGLKDAFSKMQSENVNMDGTAMLTTITVESVPTKEQLAQQQKQEKEESEVGPGGMLGGFAKRLGRKKEADDQPQGGGPPANPNTFMTMNLEVLSVSTAVAPDEVSIPAGFTQKK